MLLDVYPDRACRKASWPPLVQFGYWGSVDLACREAAPLGTPRHAAVRDGDVEAVQVRVRADDGTAGWNRPDAYPAGARRGPAKAWQPSRSRLDRVRRIQGVPMMGLVHALRAGVDCDAAVVMRPDVHERRVQHAPQVSTG